MARRRLRVPLAPLAMGMVAALGLPPFAFWPATPIALALALWQLSRAPTPARAARAALMLGAGYFGCALFWIVDPFLVEAQATGWMAPFALVLMALGGGLFWALPVWIAARTLPGDPRWRAVGIALALLLTEWLRGFVLTGFPWAQPGQAWVGTPVAQLAAWGGQLGLTALTLMLAVLPAAVTPPSEPRGRRGLAGAAIAVLVVALAWGAGSWRLAQPAPPATGLTIRLVQPNADQALKWDPVWAATFYARLLDLSAGPKAGGGTVDAVIWPETAVGFLLNDAAPVLPEIAAAAGGAPLLTGIQRAEGQRWFNSLVEITPQAAVGATYDKFHLVPFGEYVPYGDALARLGIRAFAAQAGFGYTDGPGPQVMRLPGLPAFQPLICYEAVFPQHLRHLAQRPGWIVQVTNDAWFGRFSGPWQHLAQARLRAIESGLPVMRVANTGITAAIDPRGRVTGALGLGVVGRIDAPLPGPLPPTLWLALGDGPLAALAAFAWLILALRARHGRHRIDAARPGP